MLVCIQLGKPFRQLHLEFDLGAIGVLRHQADAAGDAVGDVDYALVELELAGLELGNVEDIADQVR